MKSVDDLNMPFFRAMDDADFMLLLVFLVENVNEHGERNNLKVFCLRQIIPCLSVQDLEAED